MRTVERFLVAFAVLSLVMRYMGIKDAVPLELIALPLLVGFYALFTAPVLLRSVAPFSLHLHRGGLIAFAIFNGLALAYMLIALLRYTLAMQPWLDTVENCGALLLLCGILSIMLLGKRAAGAYWMVLLRPVVAFALVCFTAVIAPPYLHLHGI